MTEKLKIIHSRLSSVFITVLIAVSFLWPLLNWREFEAIRHNFVGIGYISAALIISEVAFVVGAVLMLGAVGTEFTGRNKFHVFIKKYRASRKSLKEVAAQAITSPAFSIGFWLNFAGAVATSLILAFGIIRFLPAVGYGLLIIVTLDLIATFAWRRPLHNARKRLNEKH